MLLLVSIVSRVDSLVRICVEDLCLAPYFFILEYSDLCWCLGYIFVFISWRTVWEFVSFQIISTNQRLDLSFNQRHVRLEPPTQDLDNLVHELRVAKLFPLPAGY